VAGHLSRTRRTPAPRLARPRPDPCRMPIAAKSARAWRTLDRKDPRQFPGNLAAGDRRRWKRNPGAAATSPQGQCQQSRRGRAAWL